MAERLFRFAMPAAIYHFEDDKIDVASIRKGLKMSQDKFADRFGLSK